VPSQSCNFFHCRILPHDDLIERIAMSADDLVHVFRKHQVAYLGASVDVVDGL